MSAAKDVSVFIISAGIIWFAIAWASHWPASWGRDDLELSPQAPLYLVGIRLPKQGRLLSRASNYGPRNLLYVVRRARISEESARHCCFVLAPTALLASAEHVVFTLSDTCPSWQPKTISFWTDEHDNETALEVLAGSFDFAPDASGCTAHQRLPVGACDHHGANSPSEQEAAAAATADAAQDGSDAVNTLVASDRALSLTAASFMAAVARELGAAAAVFFLTLAALAVAGLAYCGLPQRQSEVARSSQLLKVHSNRGDATDAAADALAAAAASGTDWGKDIFTGRLDGATAASEVRKHQLESESNWRSASQAGTGLAPLRDAEEDAEPKNQLGLAASRGTAAPSAASGLGAASSANVEQSQASRQPYAGSFSSTAATDNSSPSADVATTTGAVSLSVALADTTEAGDPEPDSSATSTTSTAPASVVPTGTASTVVATPSHQLHASAASAAASAATNAVAESKLAHKPEELSEPQPVMRPSQPHASASPRPTQSESAAVEGGRHSDGFSSEIVSRSSSALCKASSASTWGAGASPASSQPAVPAASGLNLPSSVPASASQQLTLPAPTINVSVITYVNGAIQAASQPAATAPATHAVIQAAKGAAQPGASGTAASKSGVSGAAQLSPADAASQQVHHHHHHHFHGAAPGGAQSGSSEQEFVAAQSTVSADAATVVTGIGAASGVYAPRSPGSMPEEAISGLSDGSAADSIGSAFNGQSVPASPVPQLDSTAAGPAAAAAAATTSGSSDSNVSACSSVSAVSFATGEPPQANVDAAETLSLAIAAKAWLAAEGQGAGGKFGSSTRRGVRGRSVAASMPAGASHGAPASSAATQAPGCLTARQLLLAHASASDSSSAVNFAGASGQLRIRASASGIRSAASGAEASSSDDTRHSLLRRVRGGSMSISAHAAAAARQRRAARASAPPSSAAGHRHGRGRYSQAAGAGACTASHHDDAALMGEPLPAQLIPTAANPLFCRPLVRQPLIATTGSAEAASAVALPASFDHDDHAAAAAAAAIHDTDPLISARHWGLLLSRGRALAAVNCAPAQAAARASRHTLLLRRMRSAMQPQQHQAHADDTAAASSLRRKLPAGAAAPSLVPIRRGDPLHVLAERERTWRASRGKLAPSQAQATSAFAPAVEHCVVPATADGDAAVGATHATDSGISAALPFDSKSAQSAPASPAAGSISSLSAGADSAAAAAFVLTAAVAPVPNAAVSGAVTEAASAVASATAPEPAHGTVDSTPTPMGAAAEMLKAQLQLRVRVQSASSVLPRSPQTRSEHVTERGSSSAAPMASRRVDPTQPPPAAALDVRDRLAAAFAARHSHRGFTALATAAASATQPLSFDSTSGAASNGSSGSGSEEDTDSDFGPAVDVTRASVGSSFAAAASLPSLISSWAAGATSSAAGPGRLSQPQMQMSAAAAALAVSQNAPSPGHGGMRALEAAFQAGASRLLRWSTPAWSRSAAVAPAITAGVSAGAASAAQLEASAEVANAQPPTANDSQPVEAGRATFTGTAAVGSFNNATATACDDATAAQSAGHEDTTANKRATTEYDVPDAVAAPRPHMLPLPPQAPEPAHEEAASDQLVVPAPEELGPRAPVRVLEIGESSRRLDIADGVQPLTGAAHAAEAVPAAAPLAPAGAVATPVPAPAPTEAATVLAAAFDDALFVCMLRMGVPLPAVLHKMRSDGVLDAHVDAFAAAQAQQLQVQALTSTSTAVSGVRPAPEPQNAAADACTAANVMPAPLTAITGGAAMSDVPVECVSTVTADVADEAGPGRQSLASSVAVGGAAAAAAAAAVAAASSATLSAAASTPAISGLGPALSPSPGPVAGPRPARPQPPAAQLAGRAAAASRPMPPALPGVAVAATSAEPHASVSARGPYGPHGPRGRPALLGPRPMPPPLPGTLVARHADTHSQPRPPPLPATVAGPGALHAAPAASASLPAISGLSALPTPPRPPPAFFSAAGVGAMPSPPARPRPMMSLSHARPARPSLTGTAAAGQATATSASQQSRVVGTEGAAAAAAAVVVASPQAEPSLPPQLVLPALPDPLLDLFRATFAPVTLTPLTTASSAAFCTGIRLSDGTSSAGGASAPVALQSNGVPAQSSDAQPGQTRTAEMQAADGSSQAAPASSAGLSASTSGSGGFGAMAMQLAGAAAGTAMFAATSSPSPGGKTGPRGRAAAVQLLDGKRSTNAGVALSRLRLHPAAAAAALASLCPCVPAPPGAAPLAASGGPLQVASAAAPAAIGRYIVVSEDQARLLLEQQLFPTPAEMAMLAAHALAASTQAGAATDRIAKAASSASAGALGAADADAGADAAIMDGKGSLVSSAIIAAAAAADAAAGLGLAEADTFFLALGDSLTVLLSSTAPGPVATETGAGVASKLQSAATAVAPQAVSFASTRLADRAAALLWRLALPQSLATLQTRADALAAACRDILDSAPLRQLAGQAVALATQHSQAAVSAARASGLPPGRVAAIAAAAAPPAGVPRLQHALKSLLAIKQPTSVAASATATAPAGASAGAAATALHFLVAHSRMPMIAAARAAEPAAIAESAALLEAVAAPVPALAASLLPATRPAGLAALLRGGTPSGDWDADAAGLLAEVRRESDALRRWMRLADTLQLPQPEPGCSDSNADAVASADGSGIDTGGVADSTSRSAKRALASTAEGSKPGETPIAALTSAAASRAPFRAFLAAAANAMAPLQEAALRAAAMYAQAAAALGEGTPAAAASAAVAQTRLQVGAGSAAASGSGSAAAGDAVLSGSGAPPRVVMMAAADFCAAACKALRETEAAATVAAAAVASAAAGAAMDSSAGAAAGSSSAASKSLIASTSRGFLSRHGGSISTGRGLSGAGAAGSVNAAASSPRLSFTGSRASSSSTVTAAVATGYHPLTRSLRSISIAAAAGGLRAGDAGSGGNLTVTSPLGRGFREELPSFGLRRAAAAVVTSESVGGAGDSDACSAPGRLPLRPLPASSFIAQSHNSIVSALDSAAGRSGEENEPITCKSRVAALAQRFSRR